MSTDIEQVMEALTKQAERHPQAREGGGLCHNHSELHNVPCPYARANEWLFKLLDHPLRACETCHGYGWVYSEPGPAGRETFDQVPCTNCGGTRLQHGVKP